MSGTDNKVASKTALVLGGSIAGMWMARVLRDHFDQVIVIERDRLSDRVKDRPGVPQSRQYHIMLMRGLEIMDTLFPQLKGELKAAGAVEFDYTYDVKLQARGRWLPRFRSGRIVLSFRRVLLETLMRKALRERYDVQFMDGTQVLGLVTDSDNKRVIGARVQPRRQTRNGNRETVHIEADWVVDATGRNSDASQWLRDLGYGDVPTTTINPYLGYVTRRYRQPENLDVDWRMLFLTSIEPHQPRSGLIFPEEDNIWCVMMGGINKTYPPTDDVGFMEYAEQVSPEFADAIRQAEPITPAYGYHKTENYRRHYEQMSQWLENFIVVGDATCAFDPIYGQGMTVSGLTAVALHEHLAQRNGSLDGLAPAFQGEVAKIVEPAWVMATAADLRWKGTEGGGGDNSLRTRFGRWYLDQVQEAMPYSPYIQVLFGDVVNLIEPAQALLKPRAFVRVMGHTLRGRLGG